MTKASIPDADHLEAALWVAMTAHRGQRDKGGHPYIFHPIRVCQRFTETRRQIVALLHDVLEDSAFTESFLRSEFGDEITDAVVTLSRREPESYSEFIERCGENELARSVKHADLRDNMDLSRIPNPSGADNQRRAKYHRAMDRLTDIMLAQGTEAREGRDGEAGSVHDGPAPKGCAQ